MNLELILAFIIGAIIGGGVTFKLLPGFLKSIFRETARDELSEIQDEIESRLKKLKSLTMRNLITEEEYSAKKAEVLKDMKI